MRNPNIVKVVLDKQGNALYFSRAPIPYPRDIFAVSSLTPTLAPARGTPAGAPLLRNDPSAARGERESLPENLIVLRHIGIYAYRAGFLRIFRQLAPAAIEQIEALEQLRALWHGYKIGVTVTLDAPPGGVDTEADLHAARSTFETSLT